MRWGTLLGEGKVTQKRSKSYIRIKSGESQEKVSYMNFKITTSMQQASVFHCGTGHFQHHAMKTKEKKDELLLLNRFK